MQEDKDVTQGYMDHMKKVNKGEVNKYPMRGKGKPLSQARKDALFGKKKKDADYVEERVVDNPGREDKSTYIPDPELANLRLKDIPSQYDKRKAYRDNPNEDTSLVTEAQFDEAAGEKDACYRTVKSRYKVWPSAYASGALVQCRKKGAANWGNSKKK